MKKVTNSLIAVSTLALIALTTTSCEQGHTHKNKEHKHLSTSNSDNILEKIVHSVLDTKHPAPARSKHAGHNHAVNKKRGSTQPVPVYNKPVVYTKPAPISGNNDNNQNSGPTCSISY